MGIIDEAEVLTVNGIFRNVMKEYEGFGIASTTFSTIFDNPSTSQLFGIESLGRNYRIYVESSNVYRTNKIFLLNSKNKSNEILTIPSGFSRNESGKVVIEIVDNFEYLKSPDSKSKIKSNYRKFEIDVKHIRECPIYIHEIGEVIYMPYYHPKTIHPYSVDMFHQLFDMRRDSISNGILVETALRSDIYHQLKKKEHTSVYAIVNNNVHEFTINEKPIPETINRDDVYYDVEDYDMVEENKKIIYYPIGNSNLVRDDKVKHTCMLDRISLRINTEHKVKDYHMPLTYFYQKYLAYLDVKNNVQDSCFKYVNHENGIFEIKEITFSFDRRILEKIIQEKPESQEVKEMKVAINRLEEEATTLRMENTNIEEDYKNLKSRYDSELKRQEENFTAEINRLKLEKAQNDLKMSELKYKAAQEEARNKKSSWFSNLVDKLKLINIFGKNTEEIFNRISKWSKNKSKIVSFTIEALACLAPMIIGFCVKGRAAN